MWFSGEELGISGTVFTHTVVFFFFSLLWWLSHFKTDVSAQCLVRVSHACVPLTSDLLSVEPLRFPGILCGGKLFRKANIRSFIFHHFIILRFTRGKQERIQTITRAGRGSTWTTVGPHEFRLDNGSTHSQGEHFNSIGSQNGGQVPRMGARDFPILVIPHLFVIQFSLFNEIKQSVF